MFFLMFACLAAALAGYALGFVRGEVSERTAAKRAMNAEPFPEPEPEVDEADGDDEDVDVCLRVGMPVVCRLSDVSHTHGVILGFAMSADPDGPMLAVVDVNAPHPMPIDVDLVEPRGQPAPAGYRESANPNKQWN